MENRPSNNSMLSLFSRGSTPPIAQQQYSNAQQTSSQNSPPNHIDSLFQHLTSPSTEQLNNHHHQQQHQSVSSISDTYSGSGPATPSLIDEPNIPMSPSGVSNAERQSALLSLLSGHSGGNNTRQVSHDLPSPQQQQQQQQQQQTQLQQQQQIPTPPGSSQRSGASPTNNESQGKFLLEQLMAGNAPRSNYPESQLSSLSGIGASPPYGPPPRDSEYGAYSHHDSAIEAAERAQVPIHAPIQSQQPQQQSPPAPPPQQRPASPPKSMFDFVSPFDALTSSSGSIRKKPVPQPPLNVTGGNEETWVIPDPKRRSVDNLLENLTKPISQGPAPYDPYIDYANEPSRGPLPAPPTIAPRPIAPPARVPSPPRASPPKTHVQAGRGPGGGRFNESPVGPTGASQPPSGNRRDNKESSPSSRGIRSNKGGPVGQVKQNKSNQPSPSPQPQNIIFDVAHPQEEIQAPPDFVKSTAIALVRQDSVFLHGTTIGATHWVAYAMTKGRVRVISRSSGDRTLLQLPQVFPQASMVCDMAVYGNRLAGVTSDGGFIVWELPEVITDDVPGHLMLCVPPSQDSDALKAVKWHPKEADTLAVASEHDIYLIDLANISSTRSQTVPHSELRHIANTYPHPSPIVAFDFDVLHYALATISADSTLTNWNLHDSVPYTTHKVRGEDTPSSITFVDGGIVIGRKNGTIFQLLSITNKNVLSTIKFVNGSQDDPDMFGHASYDSRIQTLWVANCRRESMIGFRISMESSVVEGEEAIRGYFDQVVEFAGPKPTIHFVILTADADPHGTEAYAACHAAKITPGDIALVAFSVHSTGVDQILIRKEWFDSALASTRAKFPQHVLPPPPVEPKVQQRQQQVPAPQPMAVPPRLRTPPSEDVEADITREEPRNPEPKQKGARGKNVNFKDKEDNGKEKGKNIDIQLNESAIGQALSKEIRKSEESIHARLGRLIGKEMDKQNQRLDDIRAQDQRQEFARQETILKLISTELTKNTTRVVEVAVKAVVQNSVLPSLETITRTEVKSALDDQIGRGFVELVGQNLPIEIEKLLLRPDISAHFSHLLLSNLTPVIERQIKEAFSSTLLQQTTAMHQELLHDLRSEIHKVKSDLMNWQNDAVRGQEASIRELDRTVRSLSDQVKYLSMNSPPASLHQLQQPPQRHSSPAPSISHSQANMNPQHMRPTNMQPNLPSAPGPSNYMPYGNYAPPPPQQQQSQQPVLGPSWHSSGIAAPQASHPATIPQAPQTEPTPPVKADQWDDIYLTVLHTQDASKLRELLAQSNPELILPLNGVPLVSQAVVLTLVHRLAAVVGEVGETPDEAFKTALWWLQRCVALLHPEDKLIADFIPRVLPNVQQLLSNTNRRLAILPVGPQTRETARILSDIQETLRRK